jgi:hypothetical protein
MVFKSLLILLTMAVVVSAKGGPPEKPEKPETPEPTPKPTPKPEPPVFKFGTPTFLGSGCPKDTVAIIPSTDGQSVSVLYSQYSAATTTDAQRDRKSCNLAVPVDVTAGVSVGIFRVDYRGNVYVPKTNDSFAQFDAEYYFAGERGPVVTKKFTPGSSKDLFISNEIAVAAIVWSPCGASTIFRVNSAITASKPKADKSEDVQIAIDSVDTTVQTGFRYYLQTKTCK